MAIMNVIHSYLAKSDLVFCIWKIGMASSVHDMSLISVHKRIATCILCKVGWRKHYFQWQMNRLAGHVRATDVFGFYQLLRDLPRIAQ